MVMEAEETGAAEAALPYPQARSFQEETARRETQVGRVMFRQAGQAAAEGEAAPAQQVQQEETPQAAEKEETD